MYITRQMLKSAGASIPRWDIEPFVYRIGDSKGGIFNPSTNTSAFSILQQVCEERGWKEFGHEEEGLFHGRQLGWNVWWKTTFSNVNSRALYSWQYVNYIPRAIGFCNKEYLARFVNVMQECYGPVYNFCPITYVLPGDFWKLDGEHFRRSQLDKDSHLSFEEESQNLVPSDPGLSELESHELDRAVVHKNFQPIWISKPIGKSQGKGIVLLDDTSSLIPSETHTVVQEYITRPLLIVGHKFDLRLYILIPSTCPLTVYVYNEGLARFAMEKYDIRNLTNNFSHLTNATLNKMSPEYSRDKDCLGMGCKWTLQHLREYFKSQNLMDWYIWQQIISIVVLTLIGESSRTGYLPHSQNCFEFLGYDILLDQDLRPWLLEVNHSPSLNADSKVDHLIKNPLLHDLFNLLGLPNHGPQNDKGHLNVGNSFSFSNQDQLHPSPTTEPMKLTDVTPIITNKHAKQIEQFKAQQLSLRNRLIQLTAIYTQNLTPVNINPKKKGRKIRKGESLSTPLTTLPLDTGGNPNSISGGEDESMSTKTKRSLKIRDWMNPIKKCGGWIRVFPFNEMSHNQSRGKTQFDAKILVTQIQDNLKIAQDLATKYPGVEDYEYSERFKITTHVTTEVWIPPFSSNPNSQ